MDAWNIDGEAVLALNLLMPRVLYRFEDLESEMWPLPQGKVMEAFIKYLVWLKCKKDNWETESEKIYDFFGNYLTVVNYRRRFYDEIEKTFTDYPRILLWQISLEFDRDDRRHVNDDSLEPELQLYKYIAEVTEHIILRKEESSLLEDIGGFIGEKTRDLQIGNNHEDRKKAEDVFRFFEPCMFLVTDENGNGTNRFYPYGLYEKIKKLIPETFEYMFKYEPLPVHKESDTESEKTESTMSEATLSQEMSDNEILEKLRNNFSDDDFSKKMSEVLSHRDDLIEPILQIPLNGYLFLEGGQRLEDISRKIHLLTLIGTKKSFSKSWEILGARKYDFCEYAQIIDKWAEHFPIKLLRKEIENQNNACIQGVLHSTNEYAVRALLAFLYKSCDVVIDSINAKYEGSEYTTYYKTLICLSVITSHNESTYRRYVSDIKRFHKKLLLDIIGIMNSNSVFGRKIRKTLEDSNIYLTRRLTFEQFIEIERLQKLSEEYDQTGCHQKRNPDERLFQKKEYEMEVDKILNAENVPFALLEEYYNRQDYIKAKFWAHEHKELNLCDFEFSTVAYNKFRDITLEKPFFYPKRSPENVNIMANYFYRELPFLDFVQSEQRMARDTVLWKRYWQGLIEKAYENFKQPEFEKPLLPIIPEYAEYLLSRADDMFSTAIENIQYVEYKAFLTESRKLQIRICLKNGAIQKEEFEELTALADDYGANYYAWSDKEIMERLSFDTDSDRLDRVNAILEPEFMVRIFEKSILWVMGHKDSELWLGAPWFGMQIFNKSYADRPAIWAKHLIKILDEWKGSENMLRKACTALGHLREPLGSKVPIKLREMAESSENKNIRDDILIQLSLFNHENFRKMYHKGNEVKRVELCKRELIIGQNREVRGKTEEE